VSKQKTILVVESKLPLLKKIKEGFEEKKFNVISARNVEQVFNAMPRKKVGKILTIENIERALKHLENLKKVDAIWLDHNLLGKENGIDFVRKFKANGGSWSKIPIFVISNTESSETIKSYVDLGISKYYIKSNHKLDTIIKDIDYLVK